MNSDELLFMEPIFHNNIWGGRRLEYVYGYEIPDGPVGECWAISAHPHGDCRIVGGPFDGKHLSELWADHRDLFGDEEGDQFPLLVKIIDALDDLSIQVHPNDDYAREHENGSLGKRECWYILDNHEHGHIVVGQKTKNAEEFRRLASEGRWDDIIAEIPSKPGDFFQVDPGTVHAILGATMVLETQQSSDVTYRVYDYDRVQADGTKRDLHLKQALDVIDFSRPAPTSGDVTAPEVDGITTLVETVSYTVLRLNVRPDAPITLARDFPFLNLSVIKGSGTIRTDSETEDLALGTHLIVTSKTDTITLEGDMTLIASYV
jgi:mannose-6-phosphate isomerase